MARYFSYKNGIQNKMLELLDIPNETAATIMSSLDNVVEKYGLQAKLICYSADNAPVNFGGAQRGGETNVFAQLQQKYENRLLGIGCNAHIIHNAVNHACGKIGAFNIEATVVSIYSHFYRFTVRVTKLKSVCETAGIEYAKLIGYGKTRFLAFKLCIDKIIEMFDALKLFFLDPQEKSVPGTLKRFFKSPISKLLLIFIRDQCQIFEDSIRKIEGDYVTGFDAANVVNQLKRSIEVHINDQFYSRDFRIELQNTENTLPFEMTVINKHGEEEILEITSEYLHKITKTFLGELFFSYCYIILLITCFYLNIRGCKQLSRKMDSRKCSDGKMELGFYENSTKLDKYSTIG